MRKLCTLFKWTFRGHRVGLLLFLSFSISITSCRTFESVPAVSKDQLYSPSYSSRAEVYDHPGSLKGPVVLGGSEIISGYDTDFNQLRAEMINQGFDGALVLDHYSEVHEEEKRNGPNLLDVLFMVFDSAYEYVPSYSTYYNTWYQINYLPFIYLDSVEQRNYLHDVRIRVEGPTGKSRAFHLEFDWQGQIKSLPQFEYKDIFSILIQPWFFLLQKGKGWARANSHNPYGLDYRRFSSSQTPDKISYRPYANTYTLKALSEKCELKLDVSGKERPVLMVKYDKSWFDFEREELLGRILKEEVAGPEGSRFFYQYTYKRKEDLPANWIAEPKDLLH